MPIIEDDKNHILYWALYSIILIVITTIIGLLSYVICIASANKSYFLWPIKILNNLLILSFWVFFSPFSEVLLGIFKCENDYHKIEVSMKCYSGVHIFLIILSLLYLIFLCFINIVLSLFISKTQSDPDDCLGKFEDYMDVFLIFFRVIMAIYTIFTLDVIYYLL